MNFTRLFFSLVPVISCSCFLIFNNVFFNHLTLIVEFVSIFHSIAIRIPIFFIHLFHFYIHNVFLTFDLILVSNLSLPIPTIISENSTFEIKYHNLWNVCSALEGVNGVTRSVRKHTDLRPEIIVNIIINFRNVIYFVDTLRQI